MTYQFIRTLPAIIFGIAAIAIAPADLKAAVYSGGHGDIGVELDGSAFHVHAHIGTGAIVDGSPLVDDEEFHGEDLIIRIPASANTGRNHVVLGGSFEEYDFTDGAFDFLGTGAGQYLWLMFADSADSSASVYGGPFFGLAAEELTPGEWTGPIEFTLSGFSGPGAFSLFTAGGTRRFDTQDLSFENDLVNVGVGGHGHFFFGFTAPGLYEVEITATGMHNMLGEITGAETFVFQVVPEPGSAAMLGFSGVALFASAVWRRRRR